MTICEYYFHKTNIMYDLVFFYVYLKIKLSIIIIHFVFVTRANNSFVVQSQIINQYFNFKVGMQSLHYCVAWYKNNVFSCTHQLQLLSIRSPMNRTTNKLFNVINIESTFQT